jgi:hypothetical protein
MESVDRPVSGLRRLLASVRPALLTALGAGVAAAAPAQTRPPAGGARLLGMGDDPIGAFDGGVG